MSKLSKIVKIDSKFVTMPPIELSTDSVWTTKKRMKIKERGFILRSENEGEHFVCEFPHNPFSTCSRPNFEHKLDAG